MKNKIHIGDLIKNKVQEKNIPINSLCSSLELSRQNIYRLFKQEFIRTDKLEIISNVLSYNFFLHYCTDEISEESTQNNNSEEIEKLKQELILTHKEIDYLKRIIEVLEERSTYYYNLVKETRVK